MYKKFHSSPIKPRRKEPGAVIPECLNRESSICRRNVDDLDSRLRGNDDSFIPSIFNRTAAKKFVLLIGLVVLAGGVLGLTGCKSGAEHGRAASSKSAKFHCPMHPTYTSDRQGDCPICGMRLVPIQSGDEPFHEPDGTDHAQRQPLFYRHPLDPDIMSHEPMKDEMGMDYVPVYPEGIGAHDPVGAGPASSLDRAPVRMSAQREQLIGVRTARVQERELINIVRASGRVAYDPELYAAVVGYKEALSGEGRVQDSPWPDVKERSAALTRAAALRLRQMGLSQSQIDRLAEAKEDPINLLLSKPGETVWVYAQIYEHEIGQVKAGQTMEIKTAALPGRTLHGRVVAVDTILDPQTRTLKVRGEVPSQGGQLKPEMFVDVEIHGNLGKSLAVPHGAVMDTGLRKIAFVKTAPGLYEPRELTLGHETDAYFQVLSGLKAGEEVATSANFLIDSESRLKSALSGAEHQH